MSEADRQTGKTTRIILRALLAASERTQRVSIVVPTAAMAEIEFERLQEFALPIAGTRSFDRSLSLPNGSVIEVLPKSLAFKDGVLMPGRIGPVFFDEVNLFER